MTVGSKIYFGQTFRGNRVAEVMPLPGGTMVGKLANGRTFILGPERLSRVTLR